LSKTKPKLFLLWLCVILALSVVPLLPVAQAPAYIVFIDAWDSTHSAMVVVPINLDGVFLGNTPTDTGGIEGSHYINANLTDTYGDNFQYWLYGGVHYLDNTFWLDETMDYQTVSAIYTSAPPPSPGPEPGESTSGIGNYTFYGLNDEDSGTCTNDPVYVTAYYSIPNTYPERFLVNGSYGYNTTIAPMYFSYNLSSNGFREYWLSDSETNIFNCSLYVFNASSLTNVVVTFRDLTGSLNSYDLCSAQRYVNGSLLTVDKRKVDVTDQVVFNVKPYTLYNIKVSDGTSYTFGDVNMLSTTIDLTLKGIEFPQSVIMSNQYVRFYGVREGIDIIITYEDTLNETTSVSFTIRYSNGTLAYATIHTGESVFQDTWTNSQANLTYYFSGTTLTGYGTFTTAQIFGGSLTSIAPWSLEFLGTFPTGIDSTQLIPAIIILFTFGIFSVLNAYLGAFLGTVVYAFMAYMGWLNVNAGVLVAAFAFSIILGITFAKRRLLT
jgi:hypothetical protein